MDKHYENVLLDEIRKRDRKIHFLQLAAGSLAAIVFGLIGLLIFL